MIKVEIVKIKNILSTLYLMSNKVMRQTVTSDRHPYINVTMHKTIFSRVNNRFSKLKKYDTIRWCHFADTL